MNANATLPYGWIQQVDSESGHPFYVDTKANPPRSIWTHPYQDEQFLQEHPDIREKVRGPNSFGSDTSLPRPSHELPRRHSFNGKEAAPLAVPPPPHKTSFFGKLKEKAARSKEEHNERKRQELQRQQQQQQMMYSHPQQYGAPQHAYPQSSYMGNRMGGMGMGGGMGGMGMGLPLLGGMAGGLLLGDVIGNDFGNNGGGDWGGGGGDWGGGGGGFGF